MATALAIVGLVVIGLVVALLSHQAVSAWMTDSQCGHGDAFCPELWEDMWNV